MEAGRPASWANRPLPRRRGQPLHLASKDAAHSGIQMGLMRNVNFVLLFLSGVSALSQLPTLPADVED